MDTRRQDDRNNDFLIGLMIGSVVGAAFAIMCAPRLAAELRQRASDAAADLGDAVSRRYRDVAGRASDFVDAAADVAGTVTAKGQAVRDDVADAVGRGADAVGRGARVVEQFAKASKTQ